MNDNTHWIEGIPLGQEKCAAEKEEKRAILSYGFETSFSFSRYILYNFASCQQEMSFSHFIEMSK